MHHNLVLFSANSDDRKYLSLLFENLGFKVKIALSGADIGEALEDGPPDIIFMDIFGGGADMCHELKSDPEYNQIPIILYRGWRHHMFWDQTDYKNLQKNTMANHVFISYGISMSELKLVLSRLLNKP